MTQDPQRILITGYGGFVSPYLIEGCARRYPATHLFGLSHAASQREVEGASPAHASVTALAGDITDGERMRDVLREARPDLVFHLAAASSGAASWRDPAAAMTINAIGFTRLVEAIQREGLTPRVIVAGSGEQYGVVPPEGNPISEETPFSPANPYAVSKVAQDQLALLFHRAYGMDIIRARAFNHFGPGQSPEFVIASFARQIALMEVGKLEPILKVGNLTSERDFLPVTSVVQAYLALAEHGKGGEAYNVGSGVARSIHSMLDTLLGMATVSIETTVDPERFRPVEAPLLCADTRKIERETGWRPDDRMAQALRDTLDYWRDAVRAATSLGAD